MQPIVIQPKNNTERKFINELLDKLGIRSKSLSEELMEDLGLAMLMREADLSDRVGEEEVMQKLKDR